jgi:DNA-binding NarL/FixJ family response regulator
MTTILICDDHPVVASGLREIISQVPDYQVLDTISTAREVALAIHHFSPDVLFLDVNMDGENMVESVPDFKSLRLNMHIVLFTSYNLPSLVKRAFALGAAGYLLKSCGQSEIFEAIEALKNDQKYIGKDVRIRQGERQKINEPNFVLMDGFEGFEHLTERERELFDLIEQGKTEEETAQLLYVSKHTVHTHRKNLMKKLGLHSTADLVRFALLRRNIVK